MEAFKQWSVGLITLPNNFEKILDKTEKKKVKKVEIDDNNNNNNSSTEDGDRIGLEVICVGLSRTGTSSLKAALSQLLPGRTYHAMDLLQEINDVETFNFWQKVSAETASKEEIQDFFCNRRYSAVCDIPCLQYWRQISAAFPKARLVLTVREPTAWYRSVATTLLPLVGQIDRWSFLLRFMCWVLYQSTFQIKLLGILFSQLRSKELQEETSAVRFYEQWNEEVISSVSPDNLLVFDVREGWDPLCKFLRLEPPDGNFPRLNDSSALVRHQWYITFLISLFVVFLLVVGCLVVTGHSWTTVLFSTLAAFLVIVSSLLLWTKVIRDRIE